MDLWIKKKDLDSYWRHLSVLQLPYQHSTAILLHLKFLMVYINFLNSTDTEIGQLLSVMLPMCLFVLNMNLTLFYAFFFKVIIHIEANSFVKQS